MTEARFPHPEMPADDFGRLTELARLCRGDILKHSVGFIHVHPAPVFDGMSGLFKKALNTKAHF